METPHTFPLIGGPFDGQTNEMALAHPPEHLVIAVPITTTQAGNTPEPQVAVYLREQAEDRDGTQTYQYRYSETRGLRPDETRR